MSHLLLAETVTSPGAIHLTAGDLVIAVLLIFVAGFTSAMLRLGMGRRLVVASFRTVVQLLLVGYLLRYIFAVDHPGLIFAAAVFMSIFAGFTAVRRPARTFRGATWRACLTLIITGLATVFIVTRVIIGAEPWYRPQYLIPLLGMILGNSLTGISLALDSLLASFSEHREEIEMQLALGATSWEAARKSVAEAVRRGMIPIINAMMVVGVVSLPGMMTGQILAGADPMEAVKYQIVVMFMIAAASTAGAIGVTVLVFRRLFSEHHQLRSELIIKR